MKFSCYKFFNCHKLSKSGISFGIHFSQTCKRVDVHLFNYILSIGKIPMYVFGKDRQFAVSDSFHETTQSRVKVLYAEPTGDVILKK